MHKQVTSHSIVIKVFIDIGDYIMIDLIWRIYILNNLCLSLYIVRTHKNYLNSKEHKPISIWYSIKTKVWCVYSNKKDLGPDI